MQSHNDDRLHIINKPTSQLQALPTDMIRNIYPYLDLATSIQIRSTSTFFLKHDLLFGPKDDLDALHLQIDILQDLLDKHTSRSAKAALRQVYCSFIILLAISLLIEEKFSETSLVDHLKNTLISAQQTNSSIDSTCIGSNTTIKIALLLCKTMAYSVCLDLCDDLQTSNKRNILWIVLIFLGLIGIVLTQSYKRRESNLLQVEEIDYLKAKIKKLKIELLIIPPSLKIKISKHKYNALNAHPKDKAYVTAKKNNARHQPPQLHGLFAHKPNLIINNLSEELSDHYHALASCDDKIESEVRITIAP
jgi:hypothetical protein